MKTHATKSTCISRLLTALALIALWLSVADAPAMPSPASHEMSGIVQSIDSKTVTILPAGEWKSMVFAWNSRETEFVRDRKFSTANSLRIGAHVQIRHSVPIFGPPFAYRIAWQMTNPTCCCNIK